ncbi:MAG: M48 family metallopeptidase [Actinomycetes bacterium]|nr:M48 family metallopeptidase [Actinomycetes bacterium]
MQALHMNVAGIDIAVQRKPIKHMHLRVNPPAGAVTVSAPLWVDDAEIERFVHAKLPWLRKHRERYRDVVQAGERRYETGETLDIWGRRYRLQLHPGRRYDLRLSGDTAVLTAPADSTAVRREQFMRDWYRGQLSEAIADRLPRWQAACGLYCTSWRCRYMVSRWGSCTTATGALRFSLRLAEHPPECLDYVIVHELAHLRVPNHGADFRALMDRLMPDWRVRRAQLRNRS